MESDQWVALLEETMAAWDWNDYLKQAEQWSTQWIDSWTLLQPYAQVAPSIQIWMDAAMAFNDQWKMALQSWEKTTSSQQSDHNEKEIAELEEKYEAAQEKLKAQKQELTNLKRALTNKEKALSKKTATATQQLKEIGEKDKAIQTLEEKLNRQAAHLKTLEAQGPKSAPIKKPVPRTQPSVAAKGV
ncbi:hypothetical protein [Desulfosarcina ovata]|uniref:Uncharacterized protein n=1 Tax=Desulfosarcina ovata subsp. ovata TaxID=2752305 RepID=A0A5K8AAS5_9BACT|nr:hypothetical protein [Desulfosarcina ovata]BBO89616.1 hypothetical protein DSCOOX_27960 [Desulfosarcina ovata subsp. ovata]